MSGARYRKAYSLVVGDHDCLDNYLPAIAAAGFDGVEPTFVDGAWPAPPEPGAGTHRVLARELRLRCDDLGLAIPSLRGGRVPWTTIPSDSGTERLRALDHTRRALESLAVMGAFDQSRDLRHDERRFLMHTHDAEHRLLGREGIVGDLGMGA